MAKNIRDYIKDHLISPLKLYPTVIQDTMLEIITDKLEDLYNYSVEFPRIVTPNKSRLDILNAIAEQFLFSIREEADIQEQVDILSNILHVYSKRGSIDTIENMWKYYGGDLPKDVKVYIPSYNIFRYNISPLSGTHQFIKGKNINVLPMNTVGTYEIKDSTNTIVGTIYIDIPGDYEIVMASKYEEDVIEFERTGVYSIGISGVYNTYKNFEITTPGYFKILRNTQKIDQFVNTPGAYEVRVSNSDYPIADLKEFMLRELVAAGSFVQFVNDIHTDIDSSLSDSNAYDIKVISEGLLEINLLSLKNQYGHVLGSTGNEYSGDALLSGWLTLITASKDGSLLESVEYRE